MNGYFKDDILALQLLLLLRVYYSTVLSVVFEDKNKVALVPAGEAESESERNRKKSDIYILGFEQYIKFYAHTHRHTYIHIHTRIKEKKTPPPPPPLPLLILTSIS